MDIKWNTAVVNPQKLINISRGDKNRMLKYLYQFQALIPVRMEALKVSLNLRTGKKLGNYYIK